MLDRQFSSVLRRSAAARRIVLAAPSLRPARWRRMQPNLIIIGAQKSGTTSLHRYLSRHPAIFMSHIKEPGYFLDATDEEAEGTTRNRIRLNLDDARLLRLMKLGYRGEPWLGESSTYYSMSPVFGSEAARNIAQRSPQARLVYVVRNPYERIASQFLWGRQNRFAEGGFEAVAEQRFRIMTAISSYAAQLEHYLEVFPRERILVLGFEELTGKPEACVRRVAAHLDLPPPAAEAAAYGHFNASRERGRLRRDQLTLPRDFVDRLETVLQPEMARFAALTGIDTAKWTSACLRSQAPAPPPQ